MQSVLRSQLNHIVRSHTPIEIRADGFINRLQEERDNMEMLELKIKKLRREKTEAEKKLSKRETEIVELKMEIFHMKHHPKSLKDLMTRFNREFVNCKCIACFDTKRCDSPSLSQIPALTCHFVPTWESVLEKYNITYEYRAIAPADGDVMGRITHPVKGAHLNSVSMLVQMGEDDLWRDVAYGTPLVVGDGDPYSAPRQKLRMLFSIIEDMRATDSGNMDEDGGSSTTSAAY